MYVDNEIVAEPADLLILLSLFNEMDKRPTNPFVPHGALTKLVEGKSALSPEELISSLHERDVHFISYEAVEEGDKDSLHVERYYTLTLEGLRWIFANADYAIEVSNSASWEFPDHLISKLWARRIELPIYPAADQLVPIDHNSREFTEFVDALDTAEEEIRGNNEFGEKDPAGKEEAISALRAIRELLTPQRIALGVVTTFIVPTLYKIADKVSEHMSDAAIQAAIKLAKALFGI